MAGKLNRLGEDLLNIEVNTIVKEEITGEKFSVSFRQALYEIATSYHQKLLEIGKKHNIDIREPIINETGGLNSYKELRERAENGVEALNVLRNVPINDINKLNRIKGHCFKIIGIFKRLEKEKTGLRRKARNSEESKWNNDYTLNDINNMPDLKLDRRDATMIKKLKDIGMEDIYLQTIIQLDGDITNRISPKFMNNFSEKLLEIHNEGVSYSLDYWTKLAEMAITVLGKIIKK